MKDSSKMEQGTVWETHLSLPLLNRGKVRDIYSVGPDKLLIVTTDRLSAFDVVLPTPIPDKGKVLNQISLFWFKKFSPFIKNHLITDDILAMGFDTQFIKTFGSELQGRSMLVHRTDPLPVECVVRGYLAGSGWKDYLKTRTICGHRLPEGLRQCQALPEPIFTPATKATVGHDMNISFEEVIRLVGKDTTEWIREASLKIFERGSEFAGQKGILIADTKFEFGKFQDQIILIDEVLTPDSSRFWPKDTYEAGKDQPSLDKQIVRNYLLELKWDQKPPGPELPRDIADRTSQAYKSVYKRLTGGTLKN